MKRSMTFLVFVAMATTGLKAEFQEIDLTIFGMDWAICAHAVSVAMKKIAGVETVEVKLKEGKALIHLKPGNTVRLEEVEHRVRENGFHPKEAAVIARGEVVSVGDTPQLNIAGPNQRYTLAASPEQLIQLKAVVGKTVSVEGTVPAATEKSISHTIQLKSFKLQPWTPEVCGAEEAATVYYAARAQRNFFGAKAATLPHWFADEKNRMNR